MTCIRFRNAFSARLDGEDPGLDDGVLRAHLDSCADCRAFVGEAERLHRLVRLSPAPEVPDLGDAVLVAIGSSAASTRRPLSDIRPLRVMLAAIALVQLVVALPALVLGSDAGLPVHSARHIGSFEVALAVGLLFAAWRPSRISGMFPFVAALATCLVVSSFLDVAEGRTTFAPEAHHLLALAGLLVMWLVGRSDDRPVRLA